MEPCRLLCSMIVKWIVKWNAVASVDNFWVVGYAWESFPSLPSLSFLLSLLCPVFCSSWVLISENFQSEFQNWRLSSFLQASCLFISHPSCATDAYQHTAKMPVVRLTSHRSAARIFLCNGFNWRLIQLLYLGKTAASKEQNITVCSSVLSRMTLGWALILIICTDW